MYVANNGNVLIFDLPHLHFGRAEDRNKVVEYLAEFVRNYYRGAFTEQRVEPREVRLNLGDEVIFTRAEQSVLEGVDSHVIIDSENLISRGQYIHYADLPRFQYRLRGIG